MINLIIKTAYATRVDIKKKRKKVSKTNPLDEKLFLPMLVPFHRAYNKLAAHPKSRKNEEITVKP